MPSNKWQIGVMYYGGRLNGQPFYTQEGGPGTVVSPREGVGPWPEWPIAGQIISTYNPWWAPPCGHSCKYLAVVREYDYINQTSVALVCCNHCYFVIRYIAPFEEYLNPIQNAILVA